MEQMQIFEKNQILTYGINFDYHKVSKTKPWRKKHLFIPWYTKNL
jgi:hypothetical protein